MKLTVLTKVKPLTARPTDSSVKSVNTKIINYGWTEHFKIQEGDKLALTPSQEGKGGLGKLKLILSPHTSKEKFESSSLLK